MAPFAKAVGAGEAGEDILDPPFGLVIEVKARDTVSLVAAITQALRSAPGAMAWVVWRHNGQGPSNMDDWTVTMRLSDAERLYRAWRNSIRD